MVTVGIFGENGRDVLKIMTSVFNKSGINFLSAGSENSTGLTDAFVEAVKNKAAVLILNVEDAYGYQKISSLKFDVLVFLINPVGSKLGLGNILKKKSYLIMDCDKPLPKEIYTHSETTFITCGFSRTASVTVSAVNLPFEEKILYCLQRELLNVRGERIEPIEISVNLDGKYVKEVLAGLTAAIVSGARV